ncbi:MAG: hypothetical protein DRI56_10605 [Chloroflexota bacterium]|nr:MAG: hypothetical protein DRI56_10605 [Chloroflexota bacterium]
MLTKNDLQELLDYQAQSPILSVYLNTNPTGGTIEDHKLQLRSMLKDIDAPKDIEIIKTYLDHEYDWRSWCSIAIFSNADENFFQAYPLAVDVRNRARLHHCPYVKPLAALFDAHSGYGVVLIDKQQARFFSFHLGELQAEARFSGEDVQRQKHGGGSQVTGRSRGVEGIAETPDGDTQRNMQEAANVAAKFLKTNNVRRVLIGGTTENVSAFQEMLPKSWQSLIVGSFAMSMNAAYGEIQEKALEIGAETEKHREEKLLQTIITEAAKGRNGLTRFGEILSAIKEGRVQTLVMKDGYKKDGYRCQGCGYITVQKLDKCPFCAGEFEHISDAAELAVRNVLQAGGSVKVVEDEKNTLDEYGGIVALLRY